MKRLLLYAFFLFCGAAGVVPALADPALRKETAQKKKPAKKTYYRKGALFVLKTERRIPLYYSRSYQKQGKTLFVTGYDVYNEKKQIICNVRAVHDKKKHTVEVSVRDFGVSGFPIVNTERTGYETPYMGRFGAIGKVGAANKKNPGQMMVKFTSHRFDYVNVVSIADAHEDSGKDLQVYILDEQAAL